MKKINKSCDDCNLKRKVYRARCKKILKDSKEPEAKIIIEIIDWHITNIEGMYVIQVIEGTIEPGQRYVINHPEKIIIDIIDWNITNIEGCYDIQVIKGTIAFQRYVLSKKLCSF